MGLLIPIAHAHTFFIAYRMTKDPAFRDLADLEVLQKAWVAQMTNVPLSWVRLTLTKSAWKERWTEVAHQGTGSGVWML